MPERKPRKRKPKSSLTKAKAKRNAQSNDLVLLDPELCRSSESEPEDYGDLNGKERWEIDGVVDSHCGENDRMSYKLRWDKTAWQRRDGTSEEWIPAPKDSHSEHNTFIKEYEARELAKHDPHDLPPADFDVLRSFLALPPGSSKNLWLQSDLLPTLALHQMQAKLDGNSQIISKFQVEDQDFAQIELPEDEQEHEDEAPAPSTAFPSRMKRERMDSPSLGGTPAHNSQVIPTPLTALKRLENAWNEAAARAGAVSITLENEFDSSIPQLKHKFVYSEMDLHWSSDIDQFPPERDAFESCHCRSECRPHVCDCQAPIFDTNTPAPRAQHSFAYNKHGYFNLNFQGVSIECNQYCRCNKTCSNRVLQRPRRVHIEIFKTEIRGWGVRSSQGIKKGQVLGSFTGEIITRENASSLKRDIAAFDMATERKIKFRDRNRYLFDLDASESTYTLDCWRVGNWTRFINHKCEPNLKIFPVCYDTLPGRGLERLAVVALRDIPAGEELTIDYDPGHEQHSSSQTSHRTVLLPMDTQPSTHFSPPPPLYSEDVQSIHPGIEPALADDQPLILITPPEGKLTFQSGFLGAEGDVSSLEGEVHIKSASMEKWNHVAIVYRSEEHVGLNKVELGFSKHTLYSQTQAPSSSTSPDIGALPGVLPFSIPLTPDTPQCLHTSTSAISHSLTVTLESSTLPAVSKSVEIHTRRYTTITSPYLPVTPRRITLDTPTPITVEVPRTIFRSGEPIPLYWDIPPPDGSVMRRGLRLRNLRAELVRLIRVDNGDDDDDGESVTSEDETGWAPGELNMSAFASPPPTAGFEKGSSMQADQQSAAVSLPSGGPMHPTIITRSGAPARLHPTRPVRIRLVLHGLSHDPQADIQRQENTHEVCASISQTTLMHDVSFHVILRASFLIDGQEKTIKGRIPVTILPRVAPQVEAPVELEDAYMKKHDKPPTKTVRAAGADHGEGPSTGPPPAFDEGGVVNDSSAPPPFADAAYTAPPLEPSGSRLPTFQESESRAAESGTPGGHLPTFFESEAAAAASSASTSQVLPPAPSGTFGEWTQNGANRMELRFPGEGSSYGFSPQDQFDGLTLGLSHEQGLPTDPTLSHPHSSAMLSPDILADINSDPPPPLTPVGDDPISNLAMRLQILAAASTDVNETAPPPPPPLDDPADPPPSINDRFRQTPGSAVPLTEAPQPVPTDSALPPYLNPGAPAPAAAGPPAYTDIPPRAAH